MNHRLLQGALGLFLLNGCGGGAAPARPDSTGKTDSTGKGDASLVAVFLDFEFDAELWIPKNADATSRIESQLLYTIGHLNGDNSVGRLDSVELTDVETTNEGDVDHVTYHAKLLVAWGKRNDVPDTYTFRLPRMVTPDGLRDFTDKYKDRCSDSHAHDVTSGIYWYYYRPDRSSCSIDAEDVVTFEATTSPSDQATSGRFPEYHKVWEDDVLRVVAVFGKYEDGATSNTDAGISAYNRFISTMKDSFEGQEYTTIPADVPSRPGVETPDITFQVSLEDGTSIELVVLLIDGVRSAGSEFNDRYHDLSERADLIGYLGHSGLGANIRALARKGSWVQGQYAIVFMNGCDTYAYVDSALWDAHSAVNPDDPEGTKYLDIVMNAMPSPFSAEPANMRAFVDALWHRDTPMTFEQIFASVTARQVVLVSGEQDNVFVPGEGGEPQAWDGMEESGTLAKDEEVRFSTPTLAVGRYVVSITGTGDADLYVRAGTEPTTTLYDCRPFRGDSNETCLVDLGATAPLHILVRGEATTSSFTLAAQPE